MKLFHESHGSGRPIIFLHGFGATSYFWRKMVPALSMRNEVHLVDLKGYGRSPKPRDGRYSIADQAELVSALMFEHKLKHVTLVGHSLGGSVAIVMAHALAVTHPDAVKSLILMSTPTGDERVPLLGKVLRNRILGPIVVAILPTRLQVRLALKFTYYHPDKITEDQVDVYADSLGAPGGKYALLETLRDIDDAAIALLKASSAAISVPTLLVWGRHDRLVPVSSGQQLQKVIKGSKLVVIEDTAHALVEETPDPVLAAIVDFLD